MTHHSNPNKTADSPGARDESLRLRDEPRPPWFVLLVGFFFIDGFFGALAVLLQLTQIRNLLDILPPFSFLMPDQQQQRRQVTRRNRLFSDTGFFSL